MLSYQQMDEVSLILYEEFARSNPMPQSSKNITEWERKRSGYIQHRRTEVVYNQKKVDDLIAKAREDKLKNSKESKIKSVVKSAKNLFIKRPSK
ncbi:MAG: hypothetical protein ABIH48_03005 [Candidatus Falkowbacteria bacterium]